MATPDLSHLRSTDYDQVYEPVEDSFLLLDALQADTDCLRGIIEQDPGRKRYCVEVGSGSGVCITFLAQQLRDAKTNVQYLATDINPSAVAISQRTAEQNKVAVRCIQTDLVTDVKEEIAGKVDVLLFNPPYVITPSDEVGAGDISSSWAGGKNGREVIDQLLPIVPDLLTEQGSFYLVVIKENIMKGTKDDITTAIPGFEATAVLSRRSGPERLSVLRYTRRKC